MTDETIATSGAKDYHVALHGTFLLEGTMVAFPLCFPGASAPPPPDESHVTALGVAADGFVYAGTSGRRARLMCGMFRGVTGAVLDLGVIDDATSVVAVCCGDKAVVAFANGPGGGRTCPICSRAREF